MKFIKKILFLIMALLSLCLTASAADTYAGVRTIVLATPTLYSGGGAYLIGTNNWVDTHHFEGIAKIDINVCTNVGNSTATITLQGSTDQTNLVTLANASYATSTSIVYTNNFYGGFSTNLITATDVVNLAGTITTPTAASAGFSTQYINANANPFTNSVSAMVVTPNGVYTVGYNISDALRYLRIIVTPGGGATNFTASAVITGVKAIVP